MFSPLAGLSFALAFLAIAMFLLWGILRQETHSPLFLAMNLPWRSENAFFWPKAYFIAAEVLFALSAGIGIVSMESGIYTLSNQAMSLLAGVILRFVVDAGPRRNSTA